MKRCALLFLILLLGPSAASVAAESRVIVRTTLGLPGLKAVCALIGCEVQYGLGDPAGQVFLVTVPDVLGTTTQNLLPNLLPNLLGTVNPLFTTLQNTTGIVSLEIDLVGKTLGATAAGVPSGLYDNTPVDYFGSTVWNGYVGQPAGQIIRLNDAQRAFSVKGSGVVAIIDTGVDPDHPALKDVLVAGYDFTRNKDGMPSEEADINQSTAAVVDGSRPAYVNQSTAAVVDQSTAAVVDNPKYAAFGHGTMVAGVVHLVAPRALIMPLKAFNADGTGYTSDVLRAIYRSVQNNAKVINMSFSFSAYSQELSKAINHANRKGVICVASAGNDGARTMVYPAGFENLVIGVASTSDSDTRSSFSNYGPNLVWLAAPGEGIITTYPFGTYAAAWGTSFSAPFLSGTVALLLDVKSSCTEAQAAQAVANAKWISSELNNGRLDVYRSVQAWRKMLGLE